MKRRFNSNAGSSTVVVNPDEVQPRDTIENTNHSVIFRLSKRAKAPLQSEARKLAKDLSDSRTSGEVLNALLGFFKQLPLDSAEETEFAAKVIIERACKEDDVANKVQMFFVLGTLLRYPGVNIKYTVEEMMRYISKEESHKVVAEILNSLGVIGKFLPVEVDLNSRILNLAKEHLQNSNQLVRCKCLHIIATLGEEQNNMDNDKLSDSLVILQHFCTDQDPRVRTCALESLLILHERGLRLSSCVYESACKALDDDYEGVRLKAVKLLWVLSQIYPERLVPSSTSDERRCVDDAFVRICQMVNDLSMKVRVEAAGLLGSLHLVSPKFLQQTLDKKVMSHLRRKKTDHEQQRDLHAAGLKGREKWMSNKKFEVLNAPREMYSEEVSLIDSGACGAFVYGLEDELLEVRSAAVDSLCELADQHPGFARLSLDFLVDMFNDEIESVRLNAIHSLRKINRHVILREDQLETILGVLEDFSWEIRDAVRELLSHCHLSTRACLHAAIYALLGNLTKYPQDKHSLWRCLKYLGRQHENLSASLVPELLSTHPFFASSEPDVDDGAYVGMVVLVLNAALKNPIIIPNLPSHTKRHYAYLRDRYPDLIPAVALEENTLTNFVKTQCHQDMEKPDNFLWKTLSRTKRVLAVNKKDSKIPMLRNIVEDLRHIINVKSRYSSTANCAMMYLSSHLKILEVQSDGFWSNPSVLCANSGCLTSDIVEELIISSYRLNALFVGLNSEQQEIVREVRLLAHIFLIILMHRRNPKAIQSSSTGVRIWEELLARLRAHNKQAGCKDEKKISLVKSLSSFQEFVESNITKPLVIIDYLSSLVTTYQLPDLDLQNQLRQVEAVITKPQGGSDNPLRFTAGLTLAIDVEAEITNIVHTPNVYVQLIFPDFTRQLFKPKPSDFRHVSDMKCRLITKVIFSHSTWSDPCYVDVSLVKKYAQDIQEQTSLDFALSVAQNEQNGGDMKVVKRKRDRTNSLQDGYVDLCSPVQIYVFPKPGPC